MYNLYIYSKNKTTLLTGISYRDCIVNLVKANVKKGFKVVKI